MRTREAHARWLLAGVVAAGWLVAAASSYAAEPVVVGQMSFRNAKALVAKAAKAAEKVWPGGGARVDEAAAELLDENILGGVDWTKPATFVILSGAAFGKRELTGVAILPLADAAKFAQTAAQGKFEVRGNFGVFSDEEGAVKFITPERLAAYSEFPKDAGAADIAMTFTVGQSLEEFMDEINEGILRLEEKAAGLGDFGPGAVVVKIVKTFRPLVKIAAKQIKSASCTVQLNEDSVDLKGQLTATEGSDLAAFFAGQPAELTDLVKYLVPEAVAASATKLDWMKLQPLANTVLGALAGPLDLKPEVQQKITTAMFGATSTGEFAQIVAGAGHEGMQILQVTRIGDAEKFRAVSKDIMQWMVGGMGAMLEMAGLKMKVEQKDNVRQYKGVSVGQITVSLQQDQGVNPFAGQMPPQVSQVAAFDTFAVTATQNPTGDLLDAAIDRIKGGGAGLETNASYQRAKAAAPPGANGVFFVLFNSLLAKFFEQIAQQQPMIALIVGGIAQADPTEEPIIGYTAFNKDTLDMGWRLPHQPIVTFATRIRNLKEQFEQPGMRRPPARDVPKAEPKKRPNIDEF